MTLKDARALKAYIHSKYSINCTVPLGQGPDGYFPTSLLKDGPCEWKSRRQFRTWLAQRRREDRRRQREYEAVLRRGRDSRSPIERMIDEACGL